MSPWKPLPGPLVGQMVKKLPAMQETRVQSLGQEDPPEKEMVTDSSIPAWRIPWTEEPSGLQFMGSQGVGHDWATNTLESLWLKSGSFLSSCVSLFPIFLPRHFLLPPFLSLPSFPSYFFLFPFLLLSSLLPPSSFFPSLSTLLSPCYVHGSNRVGQTPSWFKSSPAQVTERSSERPDDLSSLSLADWEAKPGIPAFWLPDEVMPRGNA